jgi:hypothetical protein
LQDLVRCVMDSWMAYWMAMGVILHDLRLEKVGVTSRQLRAR